MRKKTKLVYGVGVNDADYPVRPKINEKYVLCPYYRKWESMLERCYSERYREYRPTYTGCTVCEEWKTFSNFKSWMETQEWVGNELDKDILFQGNKVYSPKTCSFVSSNLNKLLTDRSGYSGAYLLGVSLRKKDGKFLAQCSDGTGRQVHLGYFDTELEAHLAWKSYKHIVACKLADEQPDLRIAEALRKRFAPETNKEGV